MQVPLELTFRGVERSADVDELITKQVAKLERVCPDLIGCRLAVERPHQHQQSGHSFRVRLELTAPPGHNLVVKRSASMGELHDELPTVLREAFSAGRRQLKEIVDRRRHDTKRHEDQRVDGFVTKLFREEGYGFVTTVDSGRTVYFHRNAVLNDDFERLEVGTGVNLVEEIGDEGPQASSLHVVDKPGHRASEEEPTRSAPPSAWG